jgi:cbb3-type cytochrome oxidase subunit 3
MWDHANQFVAVGTTSGLLPLVLFIAIIAYAFRFVGRARKRAEGERSQALFLWALGAALAGNVVAFFGISYHDQTILVWWGLIAMISAACTNVPRTQQRSRNNLTREPMLVRG